MNSTKEKYYRVLFAVAAAYDLALGVTFTFFPARAFDLLGIGGKLPAFGGYLTLLGAFVLALGCGYALVARGDLRRNADLIFAGALFKLAYAGVAFCYWAAGTLPHVVFASVFGVADAIFFCLMLECWLAVRRAPEK
jgi:hypothetical protein